MMQQPPPQQARSPSGLTLAGGARSSVVDRVKWIEKTHGPAGGQPAGAAGGAGRARLRLPKHFADSQAATATATATAAAAKVTATVATDAGAPAAVSPTKIAAAPAVSPTGAGAPLAGIKETEAEAEAETGENAPVGVRQPMPSPALSEVSTLATGSSSSSSNGSAAIKPSMGDPAAAQQHALPSAYRPPGMEMASPPGHSRMHSNTDESIVSLEDDGDGLLYMSRNSSSSSLNDFASDPVHVGQHHPAAAHSPYGMAAAAAANMSSGSSASLNRYGRAANKPLSSGSGHGEGTVYKSLGGIRGRGAPKAARRFGRAQAEDAGDRADARAGSSDGSERAEDGVAGDSLLSRLSKLSGGRPKIQDLVSNRSAPKFVKRSHHYDAKPLAEHANGSLTGSKFRGSHSQKRYV
ncbi:hypothetical protein LPJ53_005514 [Coemansia erecta]|uniref:Uncharacterized protein n=1 Tax=Coemansia erecta TaxID=147472 RepID=A0A9W7XSB4_9FUNG|nr:hypothetical protein LPJ53_005514 [Coemansia erecta]